MHWELSEDGIILNLWDWLWESNIRRIEILTKALLIGEETSIAIIEITKIPMDIQEGIINQDMKEMEPLDGLKIWIIIIINFLCFNI